MNDFLKNINFKNRSEINSFCLSAISSTKSFKEFFQKLFIISTSNKIIKKNIGSFYEHPLIELNSLKNIASLNLEKPSSEIVLRAIEILLQNSSDQINNFKNKININPEILNSPLLTDVFSRSVINNDYKIARIEASKIIAMSDNPISILEVLMELSIDNFNELGPLTYSLYRTGRFSNENFMNFIDILINPNIKNFNFKKNKLINKKKDLRIFLPNLFERQKDINLIIFFSIALRLWINESPRQLNFQNGLFSFYKKNFEIIDFKEMKIKPSKAFFKSINKALDSKDPILVASFLLNSKTSFKSNWPIELINRYDKSFQSEQKYLFIDSIQFLVKNLDNDYLISLSKYLIFFDNKYS